MVGHGIFQNLLVIEDYNIKILATKFSPLFLLHCYGQLSKIVTLIFRLFCLLQKWLLWTEMLKLLVKIVVFKLQSITLLVTRRVVLLVHCSVQNVPISLQNQEMI